MKEKTIYKVSVDGTETELEDRPPTLTDLQKAVGGYIEIVYLPQGRIMVVDEEGLCKNKPKNNKASGIVGGNICGDVVIMPEHYLE